uniref:Putative tick transposon n=1 Tax=Rhipicephalus microplus TaxID=6941 RepID=A0A6G5ABN5_RHIMP
MNKYSLFTPQQHGFRRGFSCTTQLTEFTHDIAYALDKRKTNDCILLDFKDAFDTVPHRLLLEKMTMYGINSQVIAWVTDYLTLRQQTVIVNGASSCASQVTSGVPQGSVLGPLLFLIYVDITEGVESHIRLFADDCVLYREITDSREKAFIQRDLTKISDWCTRWHMHLNLNKTVTPCKVSDIVHY